MEKYRGLKLTPMFWSEISSSYLLKVILEEHDDIAKDFIKKFLGLSADGAIKIDREQPLLDKGSIDLLINFESDKRKKILKITWDWRERIFYQNKG